jgi:hypothetical protein
MVDRRFVGYVLIILVITSIISALIFRGGGEEEVRFLSSRIPDDVPGGRPGSPSYSLDILVARDLPDLIVRLQFLVNLTGMPLARPWNETDDRSFEGLVNNVPRIRELMERIDALEDGFGLGSLYEVYELDMPDRKLHVIDFSAMMAGLAGEGQLRSIYTLYAFSVSSEDVVSVLGGYRDFFVQRGDFATTGYSVISEVRYREPSGVACFRSEEAPPSDEECGKLLDAPVGLLRFTDLSADESVHIEVTLNTIRMFGHSGIIQIVTTETGYGPGPSLAKRIGPKGT